MRNGGELSSDFVYVMFVILAQGPAFFVAPRERAVGTLIGWMVEQRYNLKVRTISKKSACKTSVGTLISYHHDRYRAYILQNTTQHPAQTTTVHKLYPPVQNRPRLQQDGMRPLDNRDVILSYFEAFKQFV